MMTLSSDKHYPTQSSGTTVSGELQTTVRTILSVSRMSNYLECAVLCGMVYDCRAAEFNSDLFTCTLIGEYSWTGNKANPQVLIYIRTNFLSGG
ncbi:hypothetical protein RRG08_044423 [Elysia crispata]|uniref:Apple domain-containing protein n=1 Tax=Elysia crispata TaxID=231223 RepID=A0AAE1DMH0_9GAST|nr:hypothetical protein RRG08_044423 [Elysia crispata]